MANVRKSLLQLVFSGSFMKRWNDKLRPMELIEVDKQAHKMVVAFALYQLNSQGLAPRERLALGEKVVEGGLFDYFYRLIITDIKPPIFYKIKENKVHYRQLTDWVLGELKPRVGSLGPDFWERMCAYLRDESEPCLARRILEAAHLYASSWEFQLIRNSNPFDAELKDIENSFRNGLEKYKDLIGVEDLRRGMFGEGSTTISRFAQFCGQLRFQKRWSQTPRIPETSVLGHMFIVAAYAYFFSLALNACPARRVNNFFAGLFHDLPELLTRDIISPVKKSIPMLGEMIKEYENKELERVILKPLRAGGYTGLTERLAYFLGLSVKDEFTCCIEEQGAAREVSFEDLQELYNSDEFNPKDGEMLKTCDSLAAFIEAYTALRNGITSDHLQQAVWRIRNDMANKTLLNYVHVGALLADFD